MGAAPCLCVLGRFVTSYNGVVDVAPRSSTVRAPTMIAVRAALHVIAVTVVLGQALSLAGEREVAITPEMDAREVNRYFSPHAHGPTQKFFVLPDAQVVVLVATMDGKSDASAMVYVFPEDTTAEGIDRWINNRHSDALYPDAAVPQRAINVPTGKFRAKADAVVSHEVGQGGDEYDRVPVEFAIDPFEDGDVVVRASRGTLDAFVRTKDLPKARAPAR